MGILLGTFAFWIFSYDIVKTDTSKVSQEDQQALFRNNAPDSNADIEMSNVRFESMNEDTLELEDNVEVHAVPGIPPVLIQPDQLNSFESVSCFAKSFGFIKMVLGRPPIAAQLVGLLVGLVPALQNVFFSSSSILFSVTTGISTMGSGLVAGLNLVLSGTLGLKLQNVSLQNFDIGIPRRTLFFFVVGKMILLPIFHLSIVFAMRDIIFPQGVNKFMMIILCFTSCTPTSNNAVLLAHLTGKSVIAGSVAISILFQYIVGLLSMSAFMMVTLTLLETL